MNPSEPQSDPARPNFPAGSAGLEELREQYEGLQNLFHAALVALILLSLGVGLFIYKQVRLLRAQLAEQRPAVSRSIADYQKNSEPLIRNFTAAMDRFAVSNRDFQPIVDKYRPALKDYLTAPLPQVLPPTTPTPTQNVKP